MASVPYQCCMGGIAPYIFALILKLYNPEKKRPAVQTGLISPNVMFN